MVKKSAQETRYCLSELHDGALAIFLRLYSGHAFFSKKLPTLSIQSGSLELQHMENTQRAIILKVWSNTKLRLRIAEADVMTFLRKWCLEQEVLNLFASLVASAEELTDEYRRDFSFSKQVYMLKKKEYKQTMTNLNMLLRKDIGGENSIEGFHRRKALY